MTGKLDGTVAVVTGASSGIGAATGYALAGAGATVVLAARRADRLKTVADRIRTSGGIAQPVAADVTDRAAATALIHDCVATHGRLDILVNNAGKMLLGPALTAPIGEWEEMLRLNAQAVMWLTHAALPHLVDAARTAERRVADLVNVSSAAGRRARAGSAVYNLTKFGLGGFSEAIRQEMAPHHVRVSTIEPGAVETELRDHIRPEVAAARPPIEWMRPEDIADLIAYTVTRPRRLVLAEILLKPTEMPD